ncbi:MAG: hypothetical protein ACREBC_31810 [Pyrinomonadaceae bacterium]
MLETTQQQTQDRTPPPAPPVQVTVDYLPATKPFHNDFVETTTLETVRTDAMNFFGVRDRQERDTYKYYLEFEKARVTNTTQTLRQLLGPERRGAHFNLIEEVTKG